MQDNCIDCGKQFYSRNGEGYCYACSIKDLINPQVNATPIKEVTELDALVRTDKNISATNTEYNEFLLENVHNDGERFTIWGIQLK